MKKIKLIALVGAVTIVALVSSCTKDKSMAKPKPVFAYDNKDVKSIIKLANPSLYHKMYVDKDLISRTIYIIKGVKDGSGNCDEEEECICSVIVISIYSAPVSDSVYVTNTSPDIDLTFASSGDASLILVNPDVPVAVDPKSVKTTTQVDGNKKVEYVPF